MADASNSHGNPIEAPETTRASNQT